MEDGLVHIQSDIKNFNVKCILKLPLFVIKVIVNMPPQNGHICIINIIKVFDKVRNFDKWNEKTLMKEMDFPSNNECFIKDILSDKGTRLESNDAIYR